MLLTPNTILGKETLKILNDLVANSVHAPTAI